MGLDMYLTGTRRLNGWTIDNVPNEVAERALYLKAAELLNVLPDLETENPSGSISFSFGYWRKASLIHAWMVEHVQGGEDHCAAYPIEREQMELLLSGCVRELDQEPGFWLVRNSVWTEDLIRDERYDRKLRETILILRRCIALLEHGWSFTYQSSW